MLNIALLGASVAAKATLGAALSAALQTAQTTARITQPELRLEGSKSATFALDHEGLVLLIGLEGTAAKDVALQTADQQIRAALAHTQTPFQVLYGSSEDQCRAALMACGPRVTPNTPAPRKPSPWVWMCDKYSDPVCEHRLLTSLLEARIASA